jgi:hypothetical protein
MKRGILIVVGLATLALVMLAGPPAVRAAGVVGTGTAASCTDAALNTALASGGLVTFNCGPVAATIDISPGAGGTGTKTISNDTTIDAAGLITISGGGSVLVFSVTEGVTFTVQNLTIADGNGAGGYGGGIASRGGTLIVNNSTFSGNTTASGYGGGISNEAALILLPNFLQQTVQGTLVVSNSTFTDNSASPGGYGGGISSRGGPLTVSNSTFSANSAFNGGGIFFDGNTISPDLSNSSATLTVSNSTFSGNSADGDVGGGILISPNANGPQTISNCTFSGNSAVGRGGGIDSASALTVANTIVASNAGGNCDFDTAPAITDAGHNLDDGTTCGFSADNGSLNNTKPDLDPAGLKDNGGPTQTIALQAGSPAINAGDEAVCAAPPVNNLDQRGFVRPGTGATNCSIGAYEYTLPGSRDCCECPTSCAAPVNGSCGDCAVVFSATCEEGALCVLHTPTPNPTLTPTATPTPIPPSSTPTPIPPSPTPTATAPGANDCCQCADFCAAPIDGTCGGCTAVFGASCMGGSCITTQALTPTPTSAPTLSAPPTNTLTITPATTPTMSLTAPVGPVVTFFGLTRADDTLLPPSGTNPAGIPVYSRLDGFDFSIVVEGRPGVSGAAVGQCAFGKSNGQTGCVTDLSSFPDLQIEASNPLGNGSPAVCDNSGPNAGGVPAIFPVSFDPTPTNINTVNDLACRFLDGTGVPVGRLLSDACVLFPEGYPLYSYANPASTMEFCGLVTSIGPFPGGDTLVTVRLRDVNGNVGVPAQIIIHVTAPTPSPTPTPTATNTPGANDCCQCADSCAAPIDGTCGGCAAVFGASCTGAVCVPRTPQPDPSSPCVGDCNGDGHVTVDEVLTMVNMALGIVDAACPGVSANPGNQITIAEILTAVNNLLDGCPAG